MFKQRITLPGLIVALVLPLAAAAQMGPPEHGTDRPGEDLRSFTAPRWQECSGSCASQKDCRAYTFVAGSGGGTCWLKDGISPARPHNMAVSGIKVMGPIERGFDRPGKDLRAGIPSDDPPACLRACQGESHCQAWTWVKPKGKGKGACWLKGNAPAALKNDCCFSGTRLAAASRNANRSVYPQPEPPTASSGKIADPGAAVMFNPQPEPPDPTAVKPRTKSIQGGTPRLKSPRYSGQTGLDGGLDGHKQTESTVVLPGQDRSSDGLEEETLQLRPSDIGITFHKLPEVTRVNAADVPEVADGPEAIRRRPPSAAMRRRTPILAALTPTPRNELLTAIAAMPGGPGLLKSIDVPAPTPAAARSVPRTGTQVAAQKLKTPVTQFVVQVPLEELLQQGLTLYASGKISPAGFDPKEPPLSYETLNGWVHSQNEPPNDKRVTVRSWEWNKPFRFWIRTPGDPESRRTYSIEIDFRGLGPLGGAFCSKCVWFGAYVDWKHTNKGTFVALVELYGDSLSSFWFYPEEGEGFDREFRWLNVTML